MSLTSTRAHTLLLDGIWGRPRRFAPLQRLLETRCGPTEVFHYDSSGRVPLDVLGGKLADVIRQKNEPVNIVGFSMGGLVIRAAHWLDGSLPIHRVAFVN